MLFLRNRIEQKVEKGFTLVEMLVVLAISTIIALIILVKNSQFNETILLDSLAYDIALTIRQAQSYGLGVRETGAGSDQFTGGYGVAFDAAASQEDVFELFWDSDEDLMYWGEGNDGDVVETFQLRSGYTIADVCVYEKIKGSSGDPGCFSTNTASNYNVIFERPNPEAIILSGNAANQYQRMEVTIEDPSGDQKIVKIFQTGQVTVE